MERRVIDELDHSDGQTPLHPDELQGLKHSHVTTRGQLDELEQANLQQGMIWLGRQKKPDILDEPFIRRLHKRLLGDVWTWAGKYRLTEKNIGIDPRQIPEQLRTLLDDVNFWIAHETFPPVEIALRFHHRLVRIHPFVNGNGRFARIVANALLAKTWGLSPIDWTGGYDLQALSPRRAQYIAALQAADRGDYSLLFSFAGYTPG
jgi:Fic-DOC domain mobile mystery protein B